MQGNQKRDTRPELALRRVLHARGLRYRVCARPVVHLNRTADIVFRPAQVAVLIHGCYWHRCSDHYKPPRTNTEYWTAKVARNVDRDAETERLLTGAGWLVLVVWAHEPTEEAADRIERVLATRRQRR